MSLLLDCCCAPECNHFNVHVGGCNAFPTTTLNLKSGGTTISSAVTDASGNAQLPYYVNGTYTIEYLPADPRYASGTTAGFAVTCGVLPSTKNITLNQAAGYIIQCCNACPGNPLPAVLHLDDGFGEVTLTFSASSLRWDGCAFRNTTAYRNVSGCGIVTATVSVPVFFSFGCSVSNTWSLTTSVIRCGGNNDYPRNGDNCSTIATFTDVSGPGGGSSASSCDPFAWSASINSTGTALSWIYGAAISANVYA